MRFVLLLVSTIFLISGMASPQAAESATSYIDEHNRFILDGKPFFPIGLYVVQCTNGSYFAELDEIADSPFDTLMNYAISECGTEATYQQIRNYLDELALRDLKVVFSLKDYISACENSYGVCDNPGPLSAEAENLITQKVTNHMDHDSVIAWYLNDETCPDCLEQLEDGYDLIKNLDSNHSVWSVHWNTTWLLQEADTTDIVGVDSYPIPDNPITWVSNVADDAMQAGKPLWFVPQLFDWPNKRPPSKEEMRAMTYLAVNHGATGLIYYSYFDIRNDADYNERWSAIKDIAGEIDQLRGVFLSTAQTNEDDVTCNNLDIDFKLMRDGNTYYLFAVNTKEGSTAGVSFQINLANKPGELNTLFEDPPRQIPVISGTVTDDFDPYEVHVYHWEGDFEEDAGTDTLQSGGSSGRSGGGGGCFIATAAFGSYMNPHVQVIKDFRDEFLLTNMPGRWFVNLYNTYGPYWADQLNAYPGCKPFVRIALMPVVGVSYFVLNTSLATKLLTGFLLLGLIPICFLRIHGRTVKNE